MRQHINKPRSVVNSHGQHKPHYQRPSLSVRSAFLRLSPAKRAHLDGIGRNTDGPFPHNFRVLSNEIRFNSHKYQSITDDELALTWEYSTGKPPPGWLPYVMREQRAGTVTEA
jgi:hypothetical protein